MRVAIIDLGTNSVRFDVHQLTAGGHVKQLHREKLMVRLGQGVFLQGRLDRTAVRRTLQAFASFRRTCLDLRAEKVIAFGTSALREAADSDKLLAAIRRQTGIDVRVISGREEANLIAEGILENEPSLRATKGKVKARFALVDIGGGSTEISVCRGKQIEHAESFPLGTARLQQVFLKTSPPAPAVKGEPSSVLQLRRYVRELLLTRMLAEEWPPVVRIVGSSGTIRALVRMNGGKPIRPGELKRLNRRMSTMNPAELLKLPGMEPKRVDMILAGSLLLEECMRILHAREVRSTDFSLRDGILYEEARLVDQHRDSNLSFHMDDILARAKRLGGIDAHLRQVVELCGTLFDRLARLHGLKKSWRDYLVAAAILHDTGEAISSTRHAQHTYYIVKNADFPSMQDWEVEFIARLCLWHQGGKVERKEIPFPGKERVNAFLKLLALIRIADALDRSHKGSATLRSVRITPKAVHLRLAGRGPLDLEILRVEQKKALFTQIFDRDIVIEHG